MKQPLSKEAHVMRVQYLTLAAVSILAAASIFVSGALVFRLVSAELGISPFFSLLLPLVAASPFMLIALRFFRKAETEHATQQVPV